MRVNARFEGVVERQVEYLVKTTGRKVSDVLRDSVAMYYQHIRTPQKSTLHHLGPLIGTGDSGRSDLSVRYKDMLTDAWSHKHGPNPTAGVAPSATTSENGVFDASSADHTHTGPEK